MKFWNFPLSLSIVVSTLQCAFEISLFRSSRAGLLFLLQPNLLLELAALLLQSISHYEQLGFILRPLSIAFHELILLLLDKI